MIAASFAAPHLLRETLMKLYYSPGACSLSPHIVLREAGLDFDLALASTKTKKLADGSDFYQVNPKGQVPVLELNDGVRLTEGPAIVQYLADQKPESGLAPKAGTIERYRLMEWLNFITSELHKGYSPLFNPAMPEEGKAVYRARTAERLQWVDSQLEGRDYLLGAQFSVADAYLFTVTNWSAVTGIDMSAFKHLAAFRERVAARPAVQAAMEAEGLKRA
jgi:glutathione S-transferase